MRLYSCKVRLDGSLHNEVVKIGVTAAEIYVLRCVHTKRSDESEAAGIVDPDVVVDIRHTGDIGRTEAEERDRLTGIYGGALTKIKGVGSIGGLFGVGNSLPQVVSDAEGIVVPDEKPVRVKKKSLLKKPAEAPKAEDDGSDGDLAELA